MPSAVAALIVFLTSGAVLVLEILAARLLAPYVGVTLETYTGIIGTVLAGISLGTWLGGRLADLVEPRRLLGPLLVAGGVLALLVVPLTGVVADLRPRADPVGIVLYAAAGFFLPAAVLSAVSPTVVKIQLRDLRETGTIVGRLSAIGTAGAIAGTFITGFVLVSAMPSRPIVVVLGLALVAGGVAVSLVAGRRSGRPASRRAEAVLVVVAVAATVGGAGATLAAEGRCERESAYFCVRVTADPARPSVRTLYLDTLRHATVDLDDPTWLGFAYTRLIGDVLGAIEPPGRPLRALHIGGGGFTMPRYIDATRPGSQHRVLELDPVVLATAQEQLGLVTSERLAVVLGDARLAIADEPDGAYDVVIGDAFGGLAVPWHLTTREFLEHVERTLSPGGLYVVNVIDHPPLDFARAKVATLRAAFDHVAVLGPPALLAGRDGGNVILVASDAPLPLDAVLAHNRGRGGRDEALGEPVALAAFAGDAPLLSDDFAPVDQLLTPR
jgi:spermidine synthase